MSTYENEDIFTTWTSELAEHDMTVVCLCGELDASTAPSFLSDVQGVVSKPRDVVADVHLLSYIDSTGVAAVLSIRNALQRAGKRLCLVGCHGLLTKILHITRIDTELRCFEDVDDAIAKRQAGEW